MRKWKNKLNSAIVCFAFFAFNITSISAQEYCQDPCCEPCSNSCFALGGDFLWWKPCVDNLDFAATGSTFIDVAEITTKFHYHSICPDWEPCFRLWAGIPGNGCKWELLASYTWNHSKDRAVAKETDGGIITNTLLHPEINEAFAYNKVSARWDTQYHSYDLLAGYPINICECQIWKPYFGVAGLVLDQEIITKNSTETTIEQIVEEEAFGQTKWNSCYWGVGLKLGTQYEHPLCEGLKVVANGSATLLAGEADNTNKQFSDTTLITGVAGLEFHDSKECHLLPGYHLSLGGEYETCICSKKISIHAGYEFLKWHNVPNPRRFFIPDEFLSGFRNTARSTSNSVTTFGYHGLYLGANLEF